MGQGRNEQGTDAQRGKDYQVTRMSWGWRLGLERGRRQGGVGRGGNGRIGMGKKAGAWREGRAGTGVRRRERSGRVWVGMGNEMEWR